MNPATALTTAEIEALCDPQHTLDETARIYENAATAQQNEAADIFDRALRVKMALDIFEERAKADLNPSANVLACFINGEYQLLKLYEATPLRSNPFLSHWVEAVQRLNPVRGQGKVNYLEREILTRPGIALARAVWIKALLLSRVTENDTRNTPLQLAKSLINNDDGSEPLILRPFIQMLEEEGIYEAEQGAQHAEPERSATLPAGAKAHHQHTAQREDDEALPPTSIEQWKLNMPQKLKDDPDGATFELTRLPVELPSLDYLNILLADRVLEAHSIDPAPVVTQFIQHALRTVEQMERPFPEIETSPGGTPNHHAIHNEHDLQYGKEAQSRAVRLLLLFIKSLIRKGLMSADVLYFEIQEICVRYVWIREVREFRTWVEEGVAQVGGS